MMTMMRTCHHRHRATVKKSGMKVQYEFFLGIITKNISSDP